MITIIILVLIKCLTNLHTVMTLTIRHFPHSACSYQPSSPFPTPNSLSFFVVVGFFFFYVLSPPLSPSVHFDRPPSIFFVFFYNWKLEFNMALNVVDIYTFPPQSNVNKYYYFYYYYYCYCYCYSNFCHHLFLQYFHLSPSFFICPLVPMYIPHLSLSLSLFLLPPLPSPLEPTGHRFVLKIDNYFSHSLVHLFIGGC